MGRYHPDKPMDRLTLTATATNIEAVKITLAGKPPLRARADGPFPPQKQQIELASKTTAKETPPLDRKDHFYLRPTGI